MLELLDIAVAGRVVDGVECPRLQDVTLRLQPGDTVALLGASGAGKSTLLAVANGLLEPTRGVVLWQGETQARTGRRRRRQQARIGTLWQDLRLIEELSVQQNLNAARLAAWGWPRALLNLLLPLETEVNAQALRQVDLDPALLGEPVAALSGGQRQRVALARLLRQQPTLLLADEPLASLDPRLAQDLLALLLAQAAPPRALLLSLHRPDLIGGFSRVVGLRQGQVVFDGSPGALSPEALTALYAGEAQSSEPRTGEAR
ncbi:ATP-binding cassette domain-containing protein [Synechococcus sp. CCY9201]|uniref:ATP-binding cassette domain-containing protein n=1 Tax=Synechococcus sp. CCY9201 TaxID=174697 RepID=UPI002B21CF0D|nr:ATP-binding cassette domain-containing protein [Synechococcus sp. CCY9201]MEA5475869.1 ATP-binding cassette domain-containing protein [Synechococcus sp. CCY9201]